MFAPMEIIRDWLSGERLKHPIPSMDGALSPNDRLEALDSLDLSLHEPDDLCDDGNGGLLVSSETQLLRVDATGSASTLSTFERPVSALARLANGTLVVAVDGIGLYHLNANGDPLSTITTLNGEPLRGVTAIAEDPLHGGVYFTAGSTHHDARDWVRDLMECNRSGLLGYWATGEQTPRLLLAGLGYANGLLVEDDGHTLVITESWNHSVTRYPVTDQGVGEARPMIRNMPGYPARISPATEGGYWLAAFAMRTHLVELILGEKTFKKDMMQSLDQELWIRPALSSNGSHLEPLQMGAMKKLGIRKPWAPPRSYGLVIRINRDGEAIDSLHSRVDGHNHGITAVREINGRLYIVSKGNNRILTAPLDENTGSTL